MSSPETPLNRIIFLVGWKVGLRWMNRLGIYSDTEPMRKLVNDMPNGSALAIVLVQKPTTAPPYVVLIIETDGRTRGYGKGVADLKKHALDFAWLAQELPDAEVHVAANSIDDAVAFSSQCPFQNDGSLMDPGDNPLATLAETLYFEDRARDLDQ